MNAQALIFPAALALAPWSSFGVDVAESASGIVERTNAFRVEQGLAHVDEDPMLEEAARRFARYMADTGRYGHTADSRQPSERAAAEGYEYCIVSENIAFRYRSTGYDDAGELARDFVQGWKESPGHRRNMVDRAVTETGVGVARSDDGRYFAVQMFGRPRSDAFRFEVENRTGERVEYRAGERAFSLRPREIGVHLQCRPTELAIKRSPDAHAFTAQVEGDRRYTVLPDRIVAEAVPGR